MSEAEPPESTEEFVAAPERERTASYVAQQLDALARTRARWKRFRLYELVCGGCGAAVAEVIDVDPSPVLVTWRPALTDVRERGVPARLVPTVRPKGIKGVWMLPWPPSPGTVPVEWPASYVMCRCSTVRIDHAEVLADLKAGTTRRVLRRAPRR